MENNLRQLAEVFPPGEFIAEELEARGWSQLDLAAILDKSPSIVNDIIKGRRPITTDVANALGKAFDTSAQLWLNLQSAYELSKSSEGDNSITRRARLYGSAPVREMIKRGWIEESDKIENLEYQVCRFYGIEKIGDDIGITHAARKPIDYEPDELLQLTWLTKARNIARGMKCNSSYKAENYDGMMAMLANYMDEVSSISNISELLLYHGVRLIIVEHLPKTKIDGACFWLNDNSPVIVLALRFDRIDYFWFTLCHELGHIKFGHGKKKPLIEVDIMAESTKRDEMRANKFAVEFLVNQKQMDNFVRTHAPRISKTKVRIFAESMGVHPGIIVGQLHHSGTVPYSHLRAHLAVVRDIITESALTDGWGKVAN